MAVLDRLKPLLLVPVLLGLVACGDHGDSSMRSGAELSVRDFERLNMEWRERRLNRLTEPHGWLSLVGLVMIEPDTSMTVGSGPDNDVVVSTGPTRWGTVRAGADSNDVRFESADVSAVSIGGDHASIGSMMADPGKDPVYVEAGGIRIQVVTPGGRPALRIRDPQAATRIRFAGLDYFPLDSSWRVAAEFIAHPEGSTIQVANVMGQLIEEPNPGMVRFKRDGKTITLEAVLEEDRLFYIFADRTSGRETYGLGRFLYSDLPRDDRVILDFNQAYNPPCAFNAFTTCPLPPQSNRIDAWVRAGERQYAGEPGIDGSRPPREL